MSKIQSFLKQFSIAHEHPDQWLSALVAHVREAQAMRLQETHTQILAVSDWAYTSPVSLQLTQRMNSLKQTRADIRILIPRVCCPSPARIADI